MKIWTVEFWRTEYNGGSDAEVYVLDSFHFTQEDAEKRRNELEEDRPWKTFYIHEYDSSSGSQYFLEFRSE